MMLEARQVTRSSPGARYHTSTALQHRQDVERVIMAVRDRINEPLMLQTLAEIARMSPCHFIRVFRRVTGIPPCQFVGALRLEMAKRLLLTTQLSVTDVCFEVGYSSLGTFTTHFRQLVGLPPSSLRRLGEDQACFSPQSLSRLGVDEERAGIPRQGLSVEINMPDSFRRPLFIGLFPTPIPQGQPVACAVAQEPGTYPIAPVDDGNYYLLAIAFAQIDDPLAYLLPDRASIRVGIGQNPVQVRNGQFSGPTDVRLRPARLTDPPILLTLPFLLADHTATGSPGDDCLRSDGYLFLGVGSSALSHDSYSEVQKG